MGLFKWRILCIVSCKFVALLAKKLKRVRGPGRCRSPLALGCSGLGAWEDWGPCRPSWCRRMPAVLWGCRGRKHQARGSWDAPWLGHSAGQQESCALALMAPRALAALQEAERLTCFPGRTHPTVSCCRALGGPRTYEIPGQAPTTSWSPLLARQVSDQQESVSLPATPLPTSIYTAKDQENRSENTASHQPRHSAGLWACCPARGFVAILPKHQSFVRCSSGTCCVPSPRASASGLRR